MATLKRCNRDELREAIGGTLSADRVRLLERHLEECSACRTGMEELAANRDQWEKISDYFSPDVTRSPRPEVSPTVAIELSRNSGGNRYEVVSALAKPVSGEEMLSPATHPELLGRIDGFQIEQIIGRGGMGVVYKGFDVELNRSVAIKVLVDHLAASGVARQRFAREAQAAAAVIHPNVVPIHRVNSSAKRPYLVMTLVSGRSLQSHVVERGPLNVKDLVRISQQIAAGLAAAHRQGLVHRDIKPANILLENDLSRVMITDFGLARAANDVAITQTGWLAGTPHYMSPEQADGHEVDQRSDLFSLGSVMYFMATGREPFRAPTPVAILSKIVKQNPESIRALNSDLTRTLSNIVERLMQKQPQHRFQTAEEVEMVLTQYLAHLEQPHQRPKPKIRKARNRISIIGRIAVGLTALAVCCLVGHQLWQDQFPPTPIRGFSDRGTGSAGLVPHDEWVTQLRQMESEVRMLESDGLPDRLVPVASDPEMQLIEAEISNLERFFSNTY